MKPYLYVEKCAYGYFWYDNEEDFKRLFKNLSKESRLNNLLEYLSTAAPGETYPFAGYLFVRLSDKD